MQLQLHVVVTAARHVEERARALVDAHDVRHLERVRGDGREQLAGELVQVEVAETRALRGPQEALAVGEPRHRRRVLRPALRPLLAHDHAARTARGIGGHELHYVLPAVRAVEQKLARVLGPFDAVDVVPDHVVAERRTVACVDLGDRAAREVEHVELGHRVGRTRLRVGLDVHHALHLGLVELQVEVGHAALVEAIEGELRAIGRPPHRRVLVELLAVHPAADRVLRALRRVAIGRDRALVRAARLAQPQVAILVERLELAVR